MLNLKRAVLTILITSMGSSLFALPSILSSADWAPDDSLLTYDSSTQREWLNLEVTAALGGFYNVIALLAPGELLEEFKLATFEEVGVLFYNGGIGPTPTGAEIFNLVTFLGDTYPEDHVYGFSGFVADFTEDGLGNGYIGVNLELGIFGSLGDTYQPFPFDQPTIGTFLYRDALVVVPAPGAFLLGAIGSGSFHFLRRRRVL